MLFTKFDLSDPAIFEKFELAQADHASSWEHYYKIYNQTFSKVIAKGLTRNYAFNPAAHALMFLLRHTLELNLKYNLKLREIDAPPVHGLTDVTAVFETPSPVPAELTNILSFFQQDTDGGCWRYWANNYDKTPYFTYADRVELAPVIRDLNKVPSSATYFFAPVSAPFDYEKNRIKWDLTLHMGQCNNDWHIKGEYDEAISMLIDMVEAGEAELKEVYLPLLFFIRHAIELALKRNIAEIQPVSNNISQKDVGALHSLCGLYNIVRNYLDTLDLTKLDKKTQDQYQEYRSYYNRLNDALHQLDSHSRAFRYPFDKDGNAQSLNLQKTQLKDILKLYQLTDPFLTFTINVLIENNLLPFDPEVHA